MKRVLIGSLAAASTNASRATCSGTPSTSNMMRPGATRVTQNSGAPLPLPMRTSIGFFETGTSGKMRIQTRPARFMWRVSARRAASIWRAVTRSGSSAFRPNSPKFSENPPFALPRIRPLNALRNLVFFGCIMVVDFHLPLGRVATVTAVALTRLAARTMRRRGVGLGLALVLRHRVVFEDLALEDPDLDPAGAVSGMRGSHAVIDLGAQGVQRHAAFAIRLHTRNFRAAQATGAVDANAFGAQTHRRLHRALHRATECDAALELLGDGIGDQGRVDFRLAHFDDVDRHFRLRQLGDLLAQFIDVRALLADYDAWASRVDVDPALLVRALDHDLRDRGLLQPFHQGLADLRVLVQQFPVLALGGIPARIPGPVDAEAKPDRIYLLSHRSTPQAALAATSRTTIVMFEKGFSMRPARPRARGLKRFITMSLPTQACATTRSSTSSSWLFSALAIADSSALRTSVEIRLLENWRSASAFETFLPRISWASRFSFCGLTRNMRTVALASLSARRRGLADCDMTF